MTGKTKTQAVASAAPVVDRQVVAELVAAAQAEGMPLSGAGGLLAQLTKIVFESSLEGEMELTWATASTIRRSPTSCWASASVAVIGWRPRPGPEVKAPG